ALSIIAWYDPAHDFSSAIAEARCLSDNCSELLNLVETMARFDRDAARNLAYEIKNPFHKVLALIALANTDPAHDIQEALQQAQALEDIDSKVDVLIKICKIDPKHDFSYAKTALLGHNSEDDYETGSAWLSIVNAQIELGELAQAEETCELIPDDFHRAFAQANVVKALLKQNSNQQAFTLTQKISYSYFKMTALIRLAKKDPKIDLSECRTLLSGLRCEVDRATFLFKLAMIDSRYLEEAKQQIPHVRSSQYVKFIQAEASRDLAAAQKEALSVEEPLLRAEALLAVAAACFAQ
ncbi:MAG: hypothetical protein LLF94_02590, partial [Chlamydiales bacterium]|nr:hypothetical protein [Chlamydiales bacterium]